tara:strand:+ start:403 stop:1041 length:639 start_codon:yes stop_codon:yes gene_type:complete
MGITERKERERTSRKKNILDAAIAIISDKGFDQVTMEEIAQKAELSKGSLYHYFRDKSALHMAIKKRGLQTIHSNFLSFLNSDKTGSKIVEEMGYSFIEFVNNNPIYTHALSLNSQLSFQEEEEELNEIENKILLLITHALQVGIQDKSIEATVDPKILAIQIEFCLRGILQFYYTNQRNHIFNILKENNMTVADTLKFFIDTILNQLDKKN